MSSEWDHIDNKLKTTLGQYQEGEPIDPWHELEKRVKRSNFLKFSTVTFNVYYLSVTLVFVFWAGFTTYRSINLNYQLKIQNKLIVHSSDSIRKHSNATIAAIPTKKMADSVPPVSSKKNNAKKPSLHQNELAENMEESALFEGLIASNYRSNDISVVCPPLNYIFNTSQELVFKVNGDMSELVVLILYNNKGNEIIERNNFSNNKLSISKRLSPGLYYWKLLKGKDLIQAGKFFIK